MWLVDEAHLQHRERFTAEDTRWAGHVAWCPCGPGGVFFSSHCGALVFTASTTG